MSLLAVDEGLPYGGLIYFCLAGPGFFTGIGLILFSLLLTAFAPSKWRRISRNLLALVGSILVIVSATPLMWWLYIALGILMAGWLGLGLYSTKRRPVLFIALRVLIASALLAAFWLELPYHIMPTIRRPETKLVVIGDSLSAGVNARETGLWPEQLFQKLGVLGQSLAKVGATVGSAHALAEKISDDADCVILEIGGNDLLGSTTANEYERGLDELLTAVSKPGRTIVMLELPLLPFTNEFGLIQRNLSARHSVILVPRRLLLSVLTGNNATSDSLHFTAVGHFAMAEAMEALFAR